MGRNVSSGSLIRAQADLFESAGSMTRATGVAHSSLELTAFVNNAVIAWALADGSSVADSSISAGAVYFSGISSAAGFYSLRFFPDRVGFWRLVLKSESLEQEVVLEFDVSAPASPAGGLNASFAR